MGRRRAGDGDMVDAEDHVGSPNGRRLTGAETATIATLLSQGLSVQDVAELVSRSPQTVLRIAGQAKELLKAASIDAVGDWIYASKIASQKGDHRPARDLLLANKIIEAHTQPSQGPSVHVQIGFALPGLPAPATPTVEMPALPAVAIPVED